MLLEGSIGLKENWNTFSSATEKNNTTTLKPPTEIIRGKLIDYDQEAFINESYEVSLTSSICGEDDADLNPRMTNIEQDIIDNTSDSSNKTVG